MLKVTKGLVLDTRPQTAEPLATTLNDFSRFGNDGTFFADGKPDWVQLPSDLWVMDFNGIDAFVSCGSDNSLDFGLGAWSVEVWVKTPNVSALRTVISRGYYSEVGGWTFIIWTEGDNLFLWANGLSLWAAFTVDDDVWHHIVLAHDGTTTHMYVDGVTRGNTNQWADYIFTIAKDLLIGVSDEGGAKLRYHNGQIALPRIYKYSLSAGRVYSHFVVEGRRWFGL
jgi:hypothetical protein